MVVSTKNCPGCGIEQSTANFWRNARMRDGLQYFCKSCMKPRIAAWQRSHRDKVRSIQRASYASRRARALGLAENDLEAMNQAQGGRCAICRNPESLRRGERVRRLNI